jgi:hypothetical protein
MLLLLLFCGGIVMILLLLLPKMSLLVRVHKLIFFVLCQRDDLHFHQHMLLSIKT